MSDLKTTDEVSAGPLDGSELVRIVQTGSSKRTTVAAIAALVLPAVETLISAVASPTTTKGDLIVHAAGRDVRLPVGTDGQVPTADSTALTGVRWETPAAGFANPSTAKGDLILHDGTTAVRLPVGANGQTLIADSTSADGVKWAAAPGGGSPTTTLGDLIVRGASADIRLPVGADAQTLIADSTQPGGVKWATAPGGGLVNFSEVLGSTTPNAGTPVAQLLASNAAANVDFVITPKGTGALLVCKPDNTAVGGSKRGSHAVDLQSGRDSSTGIASGSYAVILGGYGNTASGDYSVIGGGGYNVAAGPSSGVASGFGNTASLEGSFVGGGESNTASGTVAVVGGGAGNNATGSYSLVCAGGSNNATTSYATVCGGTSNSASGPYAFVGGGNSNIAGGGAKSYATIGGGGYNVANGDSSTIPGGRYAHARGIYGALKYASGRFAVTGDAQIGIYPQRTATADETVTALAGDGLGIGAANCIMLPDNSCFAFRSMITARDAATGHAAAWEIKGLVKRDGGAYSVAFVGVPNITVLGADAGAAGWSVAAVADTSIGALEFQATGVAGTSIRWFANTHTAELAG